MPCQPMPLRVDISLRFATFAAAGFRFSLIILVDIDRGVVAASCHAFADAAIIISLTLMLSHAMMPLMMRRLRAADAITTLSMLRCRRLMMFMPLFSLSLMMMRCRCCRYAAAFSRQVDFFFFFSLHAASHAIDARYARYILILRCCHAAAILRPCCRQRYDAIRYCYA